MKRDVLERIKNKEVVLFAMSGKMASGKDTVGSLISEKLMEEGFWVVETSFGKLIRDEIDLAVKMNNKGEDLSVLAAEEKDVKHLVALLNGEDIYGRSERSRAALQFWGTEIRRNWNPNYWIEKMEEFIEDAVLKGQSVNLTDVRFPNEADLVRKYKGDVIRLVVPKQVQIERIEARDGITVEENALNHKSEIALDNYPFPMTFDGTKDKHKITNQALSYILN